MVKQGAQVAILDINEEALQETATSSPHIYAYKCDVANIKELKKTVAEIEARLGPIDRLISCAAIMPGGKLLDSEAEQVRRLWRIKGCY